MFFMIVLVVVTVLIIVKTQAKSGGMVKVYRQLAARYGGSYTSGGWFDMPSARFFHEGVYVLVDAYSVGGRYSRYYTRVYMSLPATRLRLVVFPQRRRSQINRFPGMEDAEIGFAPFDRRYFTFTSDPGEARNFLGEGVRWQIDEIRRFLGNDDVYVSVNRTSLLVKKQSLIRDYGELAHLTEMCLELRAQAVLTQTTGIEFVDDGAVQLIDRPVCQICGEEITADMVFCRRCKTPHHRDCWNYNGQCSTYGCQERKYVVPKTAGRSAKPKKRQGKSKR